MLKAYKAEIISIGEYRWYSAYSINEAERMAEEEFGEDDVGRVMEVR